MENTGRVAPGLWEGRLGARTPRAVLEGDVAADVAIVGAGFTGLWTAYYLRTLAPELSVVVVEAETAGFGASGRNGGWCSGDLPGGLAALARRYGREAAVAMQRAAFDAVREVRRVTEREGIDCGLRMGGSRRLALTGDQARELAGIVRARRAFGFGPDDLRLLGADETRRHLAAEGVVASLFTPHCAALDPARLVRGLAAAVERRGAVVFEGSRVRELRSGLARTDRGAVRADVVVRATGEPAVACSYMVATEPLPPEFWARVGWRDRATVADQRLHFAYLQRTADDRIALGGRGIGDPARPERRERRVRDRLVATLRELFPQLGEVAVPYRWHGPLAFARDFQPSVRFDPGTGLARAGDYGGDGVALSNLAGRTLAALVAGVDAPETRLCWVGHRSPRWEPEPLRGWGIGAVNALAHGVDRYEARRGRRPALVGPLLTRVLGAG
ncbi:NAD(P)/FAD-dependent oxidoreductase [Actinomadura kijaniata]|uniref:NAD(P)/FAD-dependent oxidoreductase n=1 Tax=Actinomadura kijaniata TaxID=46161 RepID=UPI003F1B9409